uniref:Uncharacterized protein n=1 Tax=Sphaerodactylus townsendi TaxID=933632 RepID=A0ACB8EGD9_9SAUR
MRTLSEITAEENGHTNQDTLGGFNKRQGNSAAENHGYNKPSGESPGGSQLLCLPGSKSGKDSSCRLLTAWPANSFVEACESPHGYGSELEPGIPFAPSQGPLEDSHHYRSLKPNRQLGNMVEIAKQLQVTNNKRKVRDENLCEKHNEVLRFYCKDDKEAVCLLCEISHEHRNHAVVPLDDTSLEYKVGQILD